MGPPLLLEFSKLSDPLVHWEVVPNSEAALSFEFFKIVSKFRRKNQNLRPLIESKGAGLRDRWAELASCRSVVFPLKQKSERG